MRGRILYIDDDPDACAVAASVLRNRGYQVVTETSAKAAIDLALADDFDAVVTDLRLGALDGLAVCERVLAAKPSLAVVVVTGHATMDAAVGALRAGAYDFVAKPFDPDLLLAAVGRATQSSRLREEVKRLRATVETEANVGAMIGDSPAMRRVYETIARIAATDASVLVTGESGTGKELIARQIHDHSERAKGPFVAINCAAVPSQLLESELFGHVRGAFTDAKTARRGLFLEAHGGTLFLDEIGELPMEMQAKLLRALQERTVRAVGGSHEVAFDARLVTATARDLESEVAAKTFRLDLYYRINVCPIEVPPLREREGDVAVLAQRFTLRFAQRHHKSVEGITAEALAKLVSYRWPGNVRELENCMERAVTMTRSELIVPDDLPERVRDYRASAPQTLLPDSVDALLTMEELERQYVAHVLRLVGGNKSRAARVLGLDRRTLYRKLDHDKHGPSSVPPPGEPDATAARLSSLPPAPAAQLGSRPVLLVDGDSDGREILKLLLVAQGFVVEGARSVAGARALGIAAAAIVFAGTAADGDPRELVAPDGPPVLLITTDVLDHEEPGFAEVLRKPARAEDVVQRLRRMLAPQP